MNLDEQLRAALDLEAEMQNAPAPDVDRLISGGRERRRRRNSTRAGIAAAIVAVAVGVGVGVYGVTQLDSESALEPAQPSQPSESATTASPLPIDGRRLEPDTTYRTLVGVDGTGATLEADLTVSGSGWTSGNFPVVTESAAYGGVAAYGPLALAAGSGCTGDRPNTNVGQTSEALVQQLAQLPRSTVVRPAKATEAFGHDATHLRVRIDNDCPEGQGYRVAETHRASHGINYSVSPRDVVMDFWVVDLDGTPVVVEMWHDEDASSELLDKIARTRDSITLVTTG